MPYRLKKKSWQPARLRKGDHSIIIVWLLLAAVVRGLDYLTGDDKWAARDFMLAAAPQWFWALGFLIGASLLAWGVLTRRHLFVYVGHGWLWVAYTVNALALVLASSLPYLNGVRGAGATGFVALIHFIYFIRTGPIPLRIGREDAKTVERVMEGGDG